MGDPHLGVTKFFVSNLPDSSSSKDIGEVFSDFGEVVGVYVARKRDKKGNRFGFVSFRGVRDPSELEGSMKGIRMGSFKLLVNVARFAAENSKFHVQQPSKSDQTVLFGHKEMKNFNVRDHRSYCDVLGKAKVAEVADKEHGGSGGQRVVNSGKAVIVPDRTSAFKELVGSAVIGRMMDLETLVDFDKLLRIAKRRTTF
ncbi:putative RNA recognition motif domain, nucleotide-binding alpha-beta plait domain superfamily [Helianthus anomalus]